MKKWLSFARKHAWMWSKGLTWRNEAYLLQGGLLVLVKMPLPVQTDVLKGIPLR